MSDNLYDFGKPSKPETQDTTTEPTTKRTKTREYLTTGELNTGKKTLAQKVDTAFKTLEAAMQYADWPTAVKAAQTILDRAGFGPKSTIDVNQTTVDLSTLTREELAARATRVAERLKKLQSSEPKLPERVM